VVGLAFTFLAMGDQNKLGEKAKYHPSTPFQFPTCHEEITQPLTSHFI